MKRSLPGLIAGVVLLVVAFLPPVVAAAEQNENVHFAEHLLILLAGLLLGYTAESLIRSYLAPALDLSTWGSVIAGFGLLLFVATMVPAFDALADATMAMHVLQHVVILVSGGLIGLGLLAHSGASQSTASPQSR